MTRYRTRIRFSKTGDLRLISHRDLVRAFERLFRRVGVSLAMTQGFHPRPQMTFPDALALGIEGRDEVAEIVLAQQVQAEPFRQRLNQHAPAGLVIHNVQVLQPEDRKVKVERFTYELPLPADQAAGDIDGAVARLRSETTLTVKRKGKQVEIDLTQTLDELRLDGDHLKMGIRMADTRQLQPRDILAALGLQDAILQGSILTRTQVEITK